MYILLFCAVWLGIAIPILIILFFTSTRKLRRSAIFISNAIGIFIGITMGVLSVAIQVAFAVICHRREVLIIKRPTVLDGRGT